MTDREKQLFQELTVSRAKGADLLEQPFMRGVKRSVVEKYSDQAHFIYELLQNADDALAENARFVLYPDRLVFAHNGKRRFSVSDPKTEEEDTATGALGDLNAITSIANSNKTEASIGKFGVGFKAVFQYTSTPMIYDEEIRFRIDRFIVPSELEKDHPDRKPGETLFVFPFDHSERTKEEAYADISDKLCSLSFPILFLSNLKYIEVEIGDELGLYGKEIKDTYSLPDTDAEKICLTQTVGKDLLDKTLWLFSRSYDDKKHKMRYSVGFFLNEDGQLMPVSEPAFCFFPTKEVTNLNFIIHAPFLLTDSREGIRAGIPHNKQMIQLLADLAADSLAYLRDIGIRDNISLINDDILDLIPVDEDVFSDVDDKRRISFKPFYNEINRCFQKQELLPSASGFVKKENAYWAFVPQLTTMFSNEQLRQLTGNDEAQWVFTSLGRQDTLRKNKSLSTYIDSITQNWYDEDAILNGRRIRSYYSWKIEFEGITASFIEQQSFEWLHSFYKWVSETSHRTDFILDKPIFLDENRKAVAAYNKDKQLILFLPSLSGSDYITVNKQLLENADTLGFLKKIGVTPPALKDEIINKIIPLYDSKNADLDVILHFKKFFQYYLECPQTEIDEFIDIIKGCNFVCYVRADGEKGNREIASSLYYPSESLIKYFSSKPDTCFLDWSRYANIIESEQEKYLRAFFAALGVKEDIRIITRAIPYKEAQDRSLPTPKSTHGYTWTESIIDGAKEILNAISNGQDKSLSIVLWNQLIQVINTHCSDSWRSLSYLLSGRCSYFYRSSKTIGFESSDIAFFKETRWLCTINNSFVLPSEIGIEDLAPEYDTNNDAVDKIVAFLGMRPSSVKEEPSEDDNLSDEQRNQIALGKKMEAAGISSVEDLEEYIAWKTAKTKRESIDSGDHNNSQPDASNMSSGYKDEVEPDNNDTNGDSSQTDVETGIEKVTKELSRRASSERKKEKAVKAVEDELIDEDDYTPSTVDYGKQIERAKEKSASEISQIARLEELQQTVVSSKKYSFRWFYTLLEIEAYYGNGSTSNSREVSISFSRVTKDPGTNRSIILRDPDRYIPQFMEDLSDIPMILQMETGTRLIPIEVVSVQSYTLKVKLKPDVDINDIDFSKVKEAHIEAKNPQFLLESLHQKFKSLAEMGYEDSDDLQAYLPSNLEFVFGPPGTGKTTYLAKEVLLPLVKEKENVKILVLTPTNKAADVVVRRIIAEMGNDTTYKDWLIRFGVTGDQLIEDTGVFHEKTFDISALSKTITVTTVARFSYDFFMPNGKRYYLDELEWDYIVFDEASMIKIADIVYPILRKDPERFIIAGDPFQIEPISAVSIWKDENIYSMVQLSSFIDPKTVPYQYPVKLLTTQYRSIPSVGQIFSQFSYGGILSHARTEDSQKPLNIDDTIKLDSLTIIRFPVSKYESIYKPKRLQGKTPYQIYSALFTFEFVSHLSAAIAKSNENKEFSIGIIAPYKAEADLIDKLVLSADIPDTISVQAGTIHSFQGDECDMIIAVFNPPPSISSSREMFLNKQNIINVSISRARDYLVMLMPDDSTENVDNLLLIKQVESLFISSGKARIYNSHDLEKTILGSSTFLEDNAFSTSHQMVNVYGLPEKKYEIRSEDTAVDIQIHNGIMPVVIPAMQVASEVPASEEWVMSKRYGKGRIIERREDTQGIQIVVDFLSQSTPKTFYEDVVFSRGTLTKLTY